MKIYRFEHKKTKQGMFTSDLKDIEEYRELQRNIAQTLLDHFREHPDDLPYPGDDFCKTFFNGEKVINKELDEFTDFITSGGIFGCHSLKQLAGWILKKKELLNDLLKCGYFLYEIEIDESKQFYHLDHQVVFKRENITRSKVLHANTLLKEFLI